MKKEAFQIYPARTSSDLIDIVRLFKAYSASLDIDLAYQEFDTELASMPGKYSPPAGELLLARNVDGQAIGCVGLRPLEIDSYCEMKRLYVSPEGRGIGLGRALVDRIIQEAKRIGYHEIRLDTLPSMTEAIELYKKFGFTQVNAYYDTPISGTIFLSKII